MASCHPHLPIQPCPWRGHDTAKATRASEPLACSLTCQLCHLGKGETVPTHSVGLLSGMHTFGEGN